MMPFWIALTLAQGAAPAATAAVEPILATQHYLRALQDRSDRQWAFMVSGMAECGDPRALKSIESAPMNPETRKAVTVALALMGDASQQPRVIQIIRSDQDPLLRMMAIKSLKALGPKGFDDLLKPFEKDTFRVKGGLQGRAVYPVRQVAREVLESAKNTEAIEIGRRKREKFMAAVRDLAGFKSSHVEDLDKLRAIVRVK